MTAKLKSDALRVIKSSAATARTLKTTSAAAISGASTVMWTVPVTSTTLKRMLPM